MIVILIIHVNNYIVKFFSWQILQQKKGYTRFSGYSLIPLTIICANDKALSLPQHPFDS